MYRAVFNTWSACPKGAPLGLYKTNVRMLGFFVFRPFWPLKPFRMAVKVLEGLMEVLEVLLEVLDLSWRSWRWFWASMY